MKTLTKRQKEIFDFISSFEKDKGFAPTIREVAKGIGVSSSSTAYKQIKSLRQKGLLQKDERRSWRSTKSSSPEDANTEELYQIAIIGSISKETRVELFASITTHLFPKSMLGEKSTYYGFIVKDNSFSEHLLLTGDLILIDSEVKPDPHDLVLLRQDAGASLAEFYTLKKSQQLLGKVIFIIRSFKFPLHQHPDQNHSAL